MRIALIFIVAILLSFTADAITLPRAPWRRAPLALAQHILAVLLLCALLMLLSARPVFSSCCAVVLLVVIGLNSNPKFETLREPLVFSDLCLCAQVFRHPRFYLPFVDIRMIAAVGAGVAVFASVWWMEPPITPRPWLMSLFAMAVCLALSYGVAARLPLTLDAATDQRRHGFFAVFMAYLFNGLSLSTARNFQAQLKAGPFAADDEGVSAPAVQARNAALNVPLASGVWPDVIVIQSESYFDARRASAAIHPAAYAQFDRACRESVTWGELAVPAWGANTMRSEFSFLTGLASEKLGHARFYPYAYLHHACASLPGWFQHHGYRTLAIHPYYTDFFRRDRVFPLLHFDRFLDITHFEQALRAGPYIADSALTDAILAETEETLGQTPRFIFAITMENHGPLHLETVQPGEAGNYHFLGEDHKWAELTIYLRHIANTDAALGHLLDRLRARSRPTVVCFYGDHVPALSRQFRALGVMPEHSEYFIWRNFGARPSVRQNVSVESLGAMTLAAMQDENTRASANRESPGFVAGTRSSTKIAAWRVIPAIRN
jgi:phosphoglycerol transferase MdoB-like AlkP superfamily enzyme